MKERIRERLRVLTGMHGIPGQEYDIARYMRDELAGLCDSVTVDNNGNVVGIKKGKEDGPKLMLIAHMDEIGFVVKNILPDGFILFDKVGSQPDKVMEGRKVLVDGKHLGVIGIKPGHLTTPEEARTAKTVKQCYIDLCCDTKKEVEALGIKIGTAITFQSDFDTMANSDCICTKAVDDRVNLAVMLELLNEIKDGDFAGTIVAAASVQEETGMKGAEMITEKVRPDYCIVLDTIPCGDTPDVDTARDLPIRLGCGPACVLADGIPGALAVTFANKKVVVALARAAKAAYVDLQMTTLVGDGYLTDAHSVFRAGGGTPGAVLAVPRRYSHSPVEVVDLNDPVESVAVLVEIVKNNGSIDLSFID